MILASKKPLAKYATRNIRIIILAKTHKQTKWKKKIIRNAIPYLTNFTTSFFFFFWYTIDKGAPKPKNKANNVVSALPSWCAYIRGKAGQEKSNKQIYK